MNIASVISFFWLRPCYDKYNGRDEKRHLNRLWLILRKGSDFDKLSSRLKITLYAGPDRREALSSYYAPVPHAHEGQKKSCYKGST